MWEGLRVWGRAFTVRCFSGQQEWAEFYLLQEVIHLFKVTDRYPQLGSAGRSGASNNCAGYFWLPLTSPCTQPHSSHSISFLYKQKSTQGLNRKTEKEMFVFLCSCPFSNVIHSSKNLWTTYSRGTLQYLISSFILFLQETLVLHLPNDTNTKSWHKQHSA